VAANQKEELNTEVAEAYGDHGEERLWVRIRDPVRPERAWWYRAGTESICSLLSMANAQKTSSLRARNFFPTDEQGHG